MLARANGHRGQTALAAATARDPKWTRNDFEADFLTLARNAGLPEPLVNHVLTAPDHPHAEVDFLWPKQRVIVETDGWETHGTRAAFEADRAKDAALTAAGYRVLRFTWRTDHATAVGRLRTMIAS